MEFSLFDNIAMVQAGETQNKTKILQKITIVSEEPAVVVDVGLWIMKHSASPFWPNLLDEIMENMKEFSNIASIKKGVQWMGIEPTTSAVLKPRHFQLDHLCISWWSLEKAVTKAKDTGNSNGSDGQQITDPEGKVVENTGQVGDENSTSQQNTESTNSVLPGIRKEEKEEVLEETCSTGKQAGKSNGSDGQQIAGSEGKIIVGRRSVEESKKGGAEGEKAIRLRRHQAYPPRKEMIEVKTKAQHRETITGTSQEARADKRPFKENVGRGRLSPRKRLVVKGRNNLPKRETNEDGKETQDAGVVEEGEKLDASVLVEILETTDGRSDKSTDDKDPLYNNSGSEESSRDSGASDNNSDEEYLEKEESKSDSMDGNVEINGNLAHAMDNTSSEEKSDEECNELEDDGNKRRVKGTTKKVDRYSLRGRKVKTWKEESTEVSSDDKREYNKEEWKGYKKRKKTGGNGMTNRGQQPKIGVKCNGKRNITNDGISMGNGSKNALDLELFLEDNVEVETASGKTKNGYEEDGWENKIMAVDSTSTVGSKQSSETTVSRQKLDNILSSNQQRDVESSNEELSVEDSTSKRELSVKDTYSEDDSTNTLDTRPDEEKFSENNSNNNNGYGDKTENENVGHSMNEITLQYKSENKGIGGPNLEVGDEQDKEEGDDNDNDNDKDDEDRSLM
eukprot:jgi/Psemu1/27618/gm1.27618_g